ncbi:MAG: hypothetical protein AB1714_21690 [Acidobacteriota bacterium]
MPDRPPVLTRVVARLRVETRDCGLWLGTHWGRRLCSGALLWGLVLIAAGACADRSRAASAGSEGPAQSPGSRDIHIAVGEEAREDQVCIKGRIIIDGTARRNVLAIGGEVGLYGVVKGDVISVGASVRMGPKAVIEGDLVCFGSSLDRAEGSQVLGETIYVNTPRELIDPLLSRLEWNPLAYRWSPLLVGAKVVMLCTWFLMGALVIVAFPVQVKFTADEIPVHFVRFGIIGLLWVATLLLTALFLAFLALLLVGIPLLLLLIVFAIVIKIFGNICIYYSVGSRLARALGWHRAHEVLHMLLGLALLGFIQFVPIVGWMVWSLLGIIGMGAALATKFGTGQPWLSRKKT